MVPESAAVVGPLSSAPPPLLVASSAFLPDSVKMSLMATLKHCVRQEPEASGIHPSYVSAPDPPFVLSMFQPVPPVDDGSIPASLLPPGHVEGVEAPSPSGLPEGSDVVTSSASPDVHLSRKNG